MIVIKFRNLLSIINRHDIIFADRDIYINKLQEEFRRIKAELRDITTTDGNVLGKKLFIGNITDDVEYTQSYNRTYEQNLWHNQPPFHNQNVLDELLNIYGTDLPDDMHATFMVKIPAPGGLITKINVTHLKCRIHFCLTMEWNYESGKMKHAPLIITSNYALYGTVGEKLKEALQQFNDVAKKMSA